MTENGRSVWKEASIGALTTPKTTYTNFLMGLHNLWNIKSEEALQAVTTYRDWLEVDLQRQRDEQADLNAIGVSKFPLDVLFDYSYVLGEAELNFLVDLIARLEERNKESQTTPQNQNSTTED